MYPEDANRKIGLSAEEYAKIQEKHENKKDRMYAELSKAVKNRPQKSNQSSEVISTLLRLQPALSPDFEAINQYPKVVSSTKMDTVYTILSKNMI